MPQLCSDHRLIIAVLVVILVKEVASQTMDEIIAGVSESNGGFEMDDGNANTVTQELDMVLTMEQYRALHDVKQDAASGSSRYKRKAVLREQYRWTNKVIPYRIASGVFNAKDMGEIRRAIDEWQNYTCIAFKEAGRDDRNFIMIGYGHGCYSNVGMIGGTQHLGLAEGCRVKGIIVHELGHAVGFHHEQSRPDRDDHVTIIKENIQDNRYNNFQKYDWTGATTLDVPYDYKSVMHYGGTYFSKNGQVTIKTNDPAYQNVIGSRVGLSFFDIKLANLMYKCNSGCPANKVCPHPGFVGKDCKCWCPGDPVKLCGNDVGVSTKNPSAKCEDLNSDCPKMAQKGQCLANKRTKENCKKSCGTCTVDPVNPSGNKVGVSTKNPSAKCEDLNSDCPKMAQKGQCLTNKRTKENCKKSCGTCTVDPVNPSGNKVRVSTKNPSVKCEDLEAGCPGWAEAGYCQTNTHTKKHCKKSCGTCTGDPVNPSGNKVRVSTKNPSVKCEDLEAGCPGWAEAGYCQTNTHTKKHCKKSCGTCTGDPVNPSGNKVRVSTKNPSVKCEDFEAGCPGWAEAGYCQTNTHTKEKCKKSCGTCR